jgi:hypothetical protein
MACSGCRVGSTCRKGLVHRGSYANPKYRGAIGEDPHLELAREKAQVTITYKQGERVRNIAGQVDCVVKEPEAGYVTLRVKKGRSLVAAPRSSDLDRGWW